MRITVIGLGYVGTVVAACMADSGNDVCVVDVNATKVAQLNQGESPILEFGISDLVGRNVAAGRLRAERTLASVPPGSSATIICVGTPSSPSGDVHLGDLVSVVDEVGAMLAATDEWHLVVLTSTVPPGTTSDLVAPRLAEVSGKKCGVDFGVAFSPEFLREGSAVADYRNPAKTVIGASDGEALDAACELFAPYAPSILKTDLRSAEMVKLADNAWHALKITYANEVGRVCSSLGVDAQSVMEIFKRDTRLNISAAYLSPGFAFGGSCLSKDLRTVTYRARQSGVETPVLDAILRSNRSHVDYALERIQSLGVRKLALLGLAFKAGTDDLRESPSLELAERLIGKGYEIAIHDEYVNLQRLVGANKDHVER